MQKLLQMLELQQQLNDATNGENWEAGVTKNGKTIDWKRCIYMESAEMIDSFAWKHWKSIAAETDWANLQIEVVDVWHFVMSLALERYKQEALGPVEELAQALSGMEAYLAVDVETVFEYADPAALMAEIEMLMATVLERGGCDIVRLCEQFFTLSRMCGLNLHQLYRLYVGKNILNRFRQDHGYKEGTYIKLWNGLEDNVVMKQVWEEKGDLTPEALYSELKRVYDALR